MENKVKTLYGWKFSEHLSEYLYMRDHGDHVSAKKELKFLDRMVSGEFDQDAFDDK